MMSLSLKRLSIAICVVFSVAAASAYGAVKIGQQAPDFGLEAHDGNTYRLGDYKGKYVVLEWLNNECPFVEKHYGGNNMQKLQKAYTKKDVVWFSVISSAKGNQGYRDRKGAQETMSKREAAPTAVLLDPTGKVGRQYGAKTTPHMFVINPQGEVVYQGAIDDRPSTTRSSLKGARNYVAEALNAALKGDKIQVPSTKPYGCSVKY